MIFIKKKQKENGDIVEKFCSHHAVCRENLWKAAHLVWFRWHTMVANEMLHRTDNLISIYNRNNNEIGNKNGCKEVNIYHKF